MSINGSIVSGQSIGRGPLKFPINYHNDGEIDSFHTGSANSLFADGHAKFLSANTDIRVVARLITPRSQEIVSDL